MISFANKFFLFFFVISSLSFTEVLYCTYKRSKKEDNSSFFYQRPRVNMNEKSLTIPLKQRYLTLIKMGIKTIEGRINCGVFGGMKSDSFVKFYSSNDEVCVKIVRVNRYETFENMLKIEDLSKMIPDIKGIDEAVALYRSFPGYEEKEKRYGVVALHLELIPKK